MSKRDQFNIGDRVAVYGTISKTPEACSVVGPDSFYEIIVKDTNVKMTFKLKELDAAEENSFVETTTTEYVASQIPFPENISEIIIKYK